MNISSIKTKTLKKLEQYKKHMLKNTKIKNYITQYKENL